MEIQSGENMVTLNESMERMKRVLKPQHRSSSAPQL